MYTVEDIAELIRHHLVLSEENSDRVQSDLAELVSRIETMGYRPPVPEPILWHFCDTCGCAVDVDVLASDGSNFTADGGFHCSDCIPGREHDAGDVTTQR